MSAEERERKRIADLEAKIEEDVAAGVIRDDYIGPVDKLPYFSIRNGDEIDAESMMIRPTIPEVYRWSPIGGIPTNQAIGHTDKFIRVAHATLAVAPPAGMTAAQMRKAAICIGTIRAVSTQLYDITAEDLIPGEVIPSLLTWREAVVGPPAVAAGLQRAADVNPATARVLSLGMDFTELEVAVINQLMMVAIGVVPLQGYSLIMSEHHYLSDTKSQPFRAFKTVEGQFWKSHDLAPWFNDDLELVRDCCWHKACHPIKMDLKRGIACSARVAAMVRKAGNGAAASRLPALESDMRAANSYIALMQTVRPLLETYDGIVDYSLLVEAMRVVQQFPPERPNEVRPNVTGAPPGVDTRARAVGALAGLMARNTDVVATCYGFYCALAEKSQTLTAMATTDTLKASYALKKLRSQSQASFVAGEQAYDDYSAARAVARQKGKFRPPFLKFA